MPLRIAFAGPNADLCDNLAEKASSLLYNDSLDTVILGNPIRDIIEMVGRDDWDVSELDFLNMWSLCKRQIDAEVHTKADIVISPSCGLDQLAIQAAHFGGLKTASSSLILPSQEAQSARDAIIQRAGWVLQVIMNFTEHEMATYYDFVYAVLPVSAEVSIAPDSVLTQYQDFLKAVPIFRVVDRLPDNEDAAMDALGQEVPKWQEKMRLDSS